jgi:phage shock protein A
LKALLDLQGSLQKLVPHNGRLSKDSKFLLSALNDLKRAFRQSMFIKGAMDEFEDQVHKKTEMARKLSSNLNDMERRRKILEASDGAEIALKNLRTALRFVERDPMDFTARGHAAVALNQAKAQVALLNELVGDPSFSSSGNLDDAVARLFGLLSSKPNTKQETELLSTDILSQLAKLASLGREAALKAKDTSRNKLTSSANELDNAISTLKQLMQALAESPNDPQLKTQLKSLFDRIRTNSNTLAAESPEGFRSRMKQNVKELHNALDDYQNLSVTSPIEFLVKSLAHMLSQQGLAAQEAANGLKDENAKQSLINYGHSLADLAADFVVCGADLSANPNDDNLKTKLRSLINMASEYNDGIRRLATHDPKILSYGKKLQRSLNYLGNTTYDQEFKGFDAILQKIVQHTVKGREGAAKTKDPGVKQKLSDYCDELEDLVPMLVESMNEMLKDTSNPDLRKDFLRLMEKGQDLCDKISKLLPQDSFFSTNRKNLDASIRDLSNILDLLARGKTIAQKFESDFDKLIKDITAFSQSTSDQGKKQKSLEILAKLNEIRGDYFPTLKSAFLDRSNESKKKLGQLFQRIADETSKLEKLDIKSKTDAMKTIHVNSQALKDFVDNLPNEISEKDKVMTKFLSTSILPKTVTKRSSCCGLS